MSNNTASNRNVFSVALTADFYHADGSPKYADMGLSVFEDVPYITCTPFTEHQAQITPEQICDAQGVIVLTPAVLASTVSRAEKLLAFGRFGVGYDAVDVDACTQADVAVFITRGAVDRSVAEATVGWMLALTHQVRAKDLLVRTGQWDERSKFMGCELRDRTFGTVGLGGIAQKTMALLRGFGMNKPIAFDPFVSQEKASELGVELVELDELMRRADFVSIHCPLSDATKGLIGEHQLKLMKPEAYLINTARGGIVDEEALYTVLQSSRIAGAALDCFADEPVTSAHRLGELPNVLLAPHCIAWTNELFRDIGRAVCHGMVDLSCGKMPNGVVNPEVFKRKTYQEKWNRYIQKTQITDGSNHHE